MRSDGELLSGYGETRSEDDFAELVQRYLNLVYSTALRQANGDAQLAQDVTQTVFSELARNARQLSQRPTLSGWLYTCAFFAATKAVRAERRRRVREQEAQAMTELLQVATPDSDWKALRPVLDVAMHQLTETDREAIVLRYFENRSFADVGSKLSLNENTARMRVDRAVDKLRKMLARQGVTTAASLPGVISAYAVQTAPAGLSAMLTSTALAGVATGGGAALTVAQVAAVTKAKVAIIAALVAASVATPLLIQHRAWFKSSSQGSHVIGARQPAGQAKSTGTRASDAAGKSNDAQPLRDWAMASPNEQPPTEPLMAVRTVPNTGSNALASLRPNPAPLVNKASPMTSSFSNFYAGGFAGATGGFRSGVAFGARGGFVYGSGGYSYSGGFSTGSFGTARGGSFTPDNLRRGGFRFGGGGGGEVRSGSGYAPTGTNYGRGTLVAPSGAPSGRISFGGGGGGAFSYGSGSGGSTGLVSESATYSNITLTPVNR